MRCRNALAAVVPALICGALQARFAVAQILPPSPPVALSLAWALPAATGADTSVMFTIVNGGGEADALTRVGCATAESAELEGQAGGNAAVHENRLTVPAGQTIVMGPDTPHIVLHHLVQPARAGETLHCTATFLRSGERLFEAAVRQDPPPKPPPI
jgi:copper(I)-binding protein